jgi:ATP-binding cassette, subfamily F, member 3
MLQKLQDAPTFVHEDAPQFRFVEPETTPDTPLRLHEADCGYSANAPILKNVTIELRAGERIGLLGRNGAGKSTLIKTLCDDLALLGGERFEGKGLVVGYFAQHQIDTLDPDSTPLEALRRMFKNDREQGLRNLLASYGFKGELALQQIDTLSGGERSRLALAMIAHTKPNVLVLDEPTNHLDLEAREALTTALASFEGTLIIVSHDRHMLRATADDLWLVADGGVKPFDGDLDDYKSWLSKNAKADKAEKDKKLAKANKVTSEVVAIEKPVAAPVVDKKLSAEQRQQNAALRKPLQNELKKLEIDLAKLQTAISPLTAKLADGSFYNTASADEVAKTLREHQQLTAKIEPIEAKWLELEVALEALA